MRKKQFKAESRKLLDLMINSIYTNKEIFLRELISNASDALDKLYYQSLSSGDTGVQRSDFVIRITPDKENRTLTISDNGIGMSQEEMEANLGTIAKSGSLEFKEKMSGIEQDSEENKEKNVTDIIGQFGVGFYSAFMVADRVTVTSRAYGSEEASCWESSGADGYTISPCEKETVGTDIVLYLKEDQENENYSRFLETYTIEDLVKRYSDYIRYPIRMMETKSRRIEKEEAEGENDKPEYEDYEEDVVLNTMQPIWKRNPSDVSKEEYNSYYQDKFFDYQDPLRVFRTSVEGLSSYTALMFIPAHAPFDYYSKDYEKGLALYSSGVMIMEKCKDLLPDYFNFVKGLVDSQDLSLNISREMLQQDRQLKNIARNLEKKIKRELQSFLKDDRENYEKFFKEFGAQMKYGLYEGYGSHKDVLADLVMFYSSQEKKLITLDEYIAKMGEDQKYIYYAPGETVEKIDLLPQVEAAKEKGLEVLYLTDEVDEFALKMIRDYKEKEFRSISEEDLSKEISEEEKAALDKAAEENKDFLASVTEILKGKVAEVKISPALAKAPVSLVSKGEISLEMERTLNRMPMPGMPPVKAERVLEINPENSAIKALKECFDSAEKAASEEEKKALRSRLESGIRLLYGQAVLLSGLDLDDPQEFGKDIETLITK